MTTNTSHRDCTHPATSSARAICRKTRNAEKLIASASVDSCLDALAGVGMPTPGSGDFEPVRRFAAADYERETCSRCGGSGRMPYTAYEGRCFKCNQSGKGNGTVLTRAGRAAMKKFDAFIAANCTKLAHELVPGDIIRRTSGRAVTVHAVNYMTEKNGSTAIGVEGTEGYKKYANYFMSYTTRTAAGENIVNMIHPLETMQMQPRGDMFQAAIAHIAHMKGVTVRYVD